MASPSDALECQRRHRGLIEGGLAGKVSPGTALQRALSTRCRTASSTLVESISKAARTRMVHMIRGPDRKPILPCVRVGGGRDSDTGCTRGICQVALPAAAQIEPPQEVRRLYRLSQPTLALS